MRLRDKNVILTTGLIGTIVFGVFVLVRLYQDAESAASMFALIKGTNFNWPLVWVVICGFALLYFAFALVGANAEAITAANRRRKNRYVRSWDAPMEWAVDYLLNDSLLRHSLTPKDEQGATNAIADAAKSERVLVAGIPPGGALAAAIMPRRWASMSFVKRGSPTFFEEPRTPIVLIDKHTNKVAFTGLLVEKREVRLVWPPDNSANRGRI